MQNVCCSEFGFCGVAPDFCGDGCQSNCEVPTPSGRSTEPLLNRNIIYYSGWAPSRNCDAMTPEQLPLGGVTHINYAFAYIYPGTYDIVPMDETASLASMKRTTALKAKQPGLKVFIAIGGWTFSDNGTIWQPVMTQLCASSANRRTFIRKIMDFMATYAFDGVDLGESVRCFIIVLTMGCHFDDSY